MLPIRTTWQLNPAHGKRNGGEGVMGWDGMEGDMRGGGGVNEETEEESKEKKNWPCSSIIWGWIKLARAANLYLGAINRIKGEQHRHRGWLFSFFSGCHCHLKFVLNVRFGKVGGSSSPRPSRFLDFLSDTNKCRPLCLTRHYNGGFIIKCNSCSQFWQLRLL